MSRFMDTDLFIKKAKEIHGDRYDYSHVNYVRAIVKVEIVCRVHGKFLQTPNSHLCGSGCNECSKIAKGKKRRLSTEEFIRRAKEIHGNKYNYRYVNYKTQNDRVVIECFHHGCFKQLPNNHLSGKGCMRCGRESTRISSKYTIDDFIKKSSITHNNKYSYEKSVYLGSECNIDIVCPEHGLFSQKAKEHMNGAGCMKCCIVGRTGENSATYKHGKSKKHRAERYNKENYHWTKEIKKSSNCDCCGVAFDDNFIKHAHHLDGWVNFPNKRYDVNNGVCLCHNCHYDFHSKYGSGYNTKEQYLQFKETAEWVK